MFTLQSIKFKATNLLIAICLIVIITLGPTNVVNAGQLYAASDTARAELRGYVENVAGATGRVYGAKDSVGYSMDTLKIIADPSGGYIGVYHSTINNVRRVRVATSQNLLTWTFQKELASYASQPTIRASGSAFIMVWEQETPKNHLKFAYYTNRSNLLAGLTSKTYDAPRTLSTCAEGTPNIYAASSSSVTVGFHYYSNCDVDRQAKGTLNWTYSTWSASKQTNFDNALLYWGVKGNIGDRDGYLYFRGYNFGLIEGQTIKNVWSSWRTYLYDYQTGNADKLSIRTNKGSIAFANPTITSLKAPNGQNAIVITLFVPSEGAASGEAGELIYYKTY